MKSTSSWFVLAVPVLAVLVPCRAAVAQCTGAQTQLQSASSALAVEDTNKAEDILDALATSYPQCAEIVLDRGRSLYLRGQTARAEDLLRNYKELAPEDARGYAYLGRLLLDKRQYPDADAASLEALERNPLEPAALALRGQIFGMKGQPDQGIELLEHACKLDPKDAEAHFQLAILYVGAKRRSDAAAEFDKSLALVPGNASAWDYLALNLEPLGQTERANAAYRKGEEANVPGRHYDQFLDYNYGRFLAKRNQLQAAREHLDRAVELAPTVRAVWYERAKVNLLLKDYRGARVDAEKAASVADPGGVILDLQTYTLLEQIYSRLGETELANKYAELSRKTAVPIQEGR